LDTSSGQRPEAARGGDRALLAGGGDDGPGQGVLGVSLDRAGDREQGGLVGNGDRVALVIPPGKPEPPEVMPPFLVKTITNPFLKFNQSWDVAWRRAEIPAANGHGNARSGQPHTSS
jgi:hypothetical protein